jgi:hypothetical protein
MSNLLCDETAHTRENLILRMSANIRFTTIQAKIVILRKELYGISKKNLLGFEFQKVEVKFLRYF